MAEHPPEDNPGPPPRAHDVDQAADVDQAMAATPRRAFLPDDQRPVADLDQPLPIGHGQTSSQPTTVRTMLRELDVRPGQHVLDVGAGSGWTTAILGRLVGPDGSVLGLELEPELAAWGRDNVTATGLPWVRLEQAEPGLLGRPQEAPYDRILVSAQAQELPHTLVEQLADDGTMVVPVAGRLLRVHRVAGAPTSVVRLGHYRFVPLR
jgi:protein-L-isoaspartate(D-aspartate) O-methyltransferase